MTYPLRSLENASAQEIIRWSDAQFGAKLALTSSFQTQSVPLLHMVAQYAPSAVVLFLDTGFHFPETLQFRDELVSRWHLRLRVLRADPADSKAASPALYKTDPDRCCRINKVEPLRRVLPEYPAWLSGIRRDQTDARANASTFEHLPDGTLRIHPLLAWTKGDVWRYIHEYDLPVHPLLEQGYESVGCAPCTRPVTIQGRDRSGRWDGVKTECGLNTDLRGA